MTDSNKTTSLRRIPISSIGWHHEITKQFPTYSKVKAIPSDAKDSIEHILNFGTQEELITYLNSDSPSELKSYALVFCLKYGYLVFADALMDTFVFDMKDDYVIVESLIKGSYNIVEFLVSKGFCYTTCNVNPFYIISSISSMRDTSITIDGIMDLSSEAVKISELLVKIGYDIHMNNDMGFKHCMNLELLKYFVTIGVDIQAHSTDWLNNFDKNCYFKRGEVLRYMMTRGLDIETNCDVILGHAVSLLDLEILQMLDEHQVSFKERESLIGLHSSQIYGSLRDNPPCLEVLQILHKNGCNLNCLHESFIQLLVRWHRFSALKFLCEIGVDIVKKLDDIPKEATPTYETFKVLIENGVDVQKVLHWI